MFFADKSPGVTDYMMKFCPGASSMDILPSFSAIIEILVSTTANAILFPYFHLPVCHNILSNTLKILLQKIKHRIN